MLDVGVAAERAETLVGGGARGVEPLPGGSELAAMRLADAAGARLDERA